MDRRTRKLITIYEGLYPRSCVDRLYIPRSDRGRCLLIVEDCAREKKCSLAKYAAQSKEALDKIAAAELNLEITLSLWTRKKTREIYWKSGWEKHYMVNLWEKQNATMKVKSGSGWGKESWKGRPKISFVLHKNKLSELIQWSIALAGPVKLHFTDFAAEILKVSHTSLASVLTWERANTERGMIK